MIHQVSPRSPYLHAGSALPSLRVLDDLSRSPASTSVPKSRPGRHLRRSRQNLV